MSRLTRPGRPVPGVIARWFVLAVAFAGAVYVLDRFAGQHPGFWGSAVGGAGAFVLIDVARRAARKARRSFRAARPGD